MDSRTDAYARGRITEEPCAAKVARTVLKTSGGSDSLAEFNRALRCGVLWRKRSLGTASEKGNQWVERILSLREMCRLQATSTYTVLVEAMTSLFHGQPPDLSWINAGGALLLTPGEHARVC